MIEKYGRADWSSVLFTVLMGIGFAICAGCLTFLVAKFVGHNMIAEASSKVQRLIRISNLIGILCFTLSSFFSLLWMINVQIDTFHSEGRKIVGSLAIVTWAIAKMDVFFIFTCRLYVTFQHTPALQYPMVMYKSFAVFLLICMGILLLTLFVLYISGSEGAFFVIGTVVFPVDILVGIGILTLFVSRLRKMIIERKLYSKSNVFSESDVKIVLGMTKLTYLTSITLLLSIALGVVMFFRSLFGGDDTRPIYFWLLFVSQVAFVWYSAVNCIVLILLFKFAHKKYVTLCGPCHDYLEEWCIGHTKQKLHKARSKSREQVEKEARQVQMEAGISAATVMQQTHDN